MSKQIGWSIVVLVAIGAAMWAYSPDRLPSEVSDGGVVETGPVKIGVIGPFSGPVGEAGEALQQSIDLIDHSHVEVLYQDDECDPKNTLSAYQQLRQQDVHIFYVACSGSVLALAPLAAENGDLIVTAFAGSIDIRDTGLEVIRFIPDGLSIAEEMIDYFDANPEKQFALIYEQQDYAESVATKLRSVLGERIVIEESYLGEDLSVKTQLTKLDRDDVDEIIVIPVSESMVEIVYQEYQELGIGKPIVGEVNVCDYSVAPADFGIGGRCWEARLDTDGYHAFLADYEATYAVEPLYPFYTSITHDIVVILDEIVGEGNRSITEIQNALVAGRNGRISNYQFESNGEVVAGDYLQEVIF